MKNGGVVSVIVPAFNVEKTIRRCIDSLLNQSYKNLEIICLNDGSTDGTLEILNWYKARDKRIVVIDKENTGYGATINAGIARVSGEYFCILESDDTAESDMVQLLYNTARKFDADVVKGNYYEYSQITQSKVFCDYLHSVEKGKIISDPKVLCVLGPAIWTGIYRTQYVVANKIWLLETRGASFQDTGFSFKVMASNPKIVFVENAVVNYTIDNNLSSVHDKSKVFCLCNEMNEIAKYIKSKNLSWVEPLYIVFKYYSYLWNCNRLSGNAKYIFILRMYYEFQQHYTQSQIDKSYLSYSDWAMLDELVRDPEYFIKNKIIRGALSNLHDEKKNLYDSLYVDDNIVNMNQGQDLLYEYVELLINIQNSDVTDRMVDISSLSDDVLLVFYDEQSRDSRIRGLGIDKNKVNSHVLFDINISNLISNYEDIMNIAKIRAYLESVIQNHEAAYYVCQSHLSDWIQGIEDTEQVAWSQESIISLNFDFLKGKCGKYVIVISVVGVATMNQRYVVLNSERIIAKGYIRKSGYIEFEINFLENERNLSIQIYLLDTIVPSEYGISTDNRRLGIQISDVYIIKIG